MHIHSVFEKIVNELKSDSLIRGIFVTGSLARGTETEYSDLDIIVLYGENKVVEKVVDGVPVEIHYNTLESTMERFSFDAGAVYLYVYGKIVEDRFGELNKLQKEAKDKLMSYKPSVERVEKLTHKMNALVEKVTASLALKDSLKISYLLHNNFSHVVDYVYMLNSLPKPPQGLTYEIYDNLDIKP
ncbi:MAG: nucleotidyltransferase domain-containing protein, partial [Clostridia bacterium]|nr:nucleotidyltransferase domain-containing protein [Clostridia bacterium]